MHSSLALPGLLKRLENAPDWLSTVPPFLSWPGYFFSNFGLLIFNMVILTEIRISCGVPAIQTLIVCLAFIFLWVKNLLVLGSWVFLLIILSMFQISWLFHSSLLQFRFSSRIYLFSEFEKCMVSSVNFWVTLFRIWTLLPVSLPILLVIPRIFQDSRKTGFAGCREVQSLFA